MTLTETRTLIAETLSNVGTFHVTPLRPKTFKPGDGWVAVKSAEPAPSGFRATAVTFEVVLCLSSDEFLAEQLLADHMVPHLDAITANLHVTGLRVAAEVLVPSNTYAMVLTMTTEVN